jgi:hypothetical protein
MASFRASASVDGYLHEEGVMGKQKRIRIELVPREQPDVALYIQALLRIARDQLKPAPVEPSVQADDAGEEATGEVTSC